MQGLLFRNSVAHHMSFELRPGCDACP